MLRYWWFWTLVVSIFFGIENGMSFLYILGFVISVGILAMNMLAVFGCIKKNLGKALVYSVITFVCWQAISWIYGTVVAIVGIAIALGCLYLLCMYMKKAWAKGWRRKSPTFLFEKVTSITLLNLEKINLGDDFLWILKNLFYL